MKSNIPLILAVGTILASILLLVANHANDWNVFFFDFLAAMLLWSLIYQRFGWKLKRFPALMVSIVAITAIFVVIAFIFAALYWSGAYIGFDVRWDRFY